VFITRWMLRDNRAAVITQKAIFMAAIFVFAKFLPEPTHENVQEANSHILLEKWAKFKQFFNLSPVRNALYDAAWKILIDESEHDGVPRYILYWLVEELVEETIYGRWEPRPAGHPSGAYWLEPRTSCGDHGLYRDRNFLRYIEMEKADG